MVPARKRGRQSEEEEEEEDREEDGGGHAEISKKHSLSTDQTNLLAAMSEVIGVPIKAEIQQLKTAQKSMQGDVKALAKRVEEWRR